MQDVPPLQERISGCILGGALGDAMGAPYEGHRGALAIQPGRLGALSDDTQLTLATCEAITEAGGRVVPERIAARFAAWYRAGRVTGMGRSTRKALQELAAGGHWALVGAKGEYAAGNGAAMRIAPLAFVLDPAKPADRQMIRDVCRITHHNDEAYAGALAIAVAVRAAWTGAWQGGPDLMQRVYDALPDTRVRDRITFLAGFEPCNSLQQVGADFGASGFVAESVPLALLGCERLNVLGFQGMLEALIQAGGDTDTVASMAGQIAGTYVGVQGLPAKVIELLPERQQVIATATRFAAALEAGNDS